MATTSGYFRVLAFAGAALAMAVSPRALAQIDFTMGIYAYDDPNEVIWTCPPVKSALARRMGALLDEDVEIEVYLDDDYDQGVLDLTAASIDVARFPNVDNYWVIHPGVDVEVADAWRDAMVELRLEEIVPDILRDAGLTDEEALTEAALEVVEDRFGSCVEVMQQLGRAGKAGKAGKAGTNRLMVGPATILYGFSPAMLQALAEAHRGAEIAKVNQLPATAAGQPRQSVGDKAKAGCGCP